MTIFKIGLTSTSDFKKYYFITIDTDLKSIVCDCPGFKFWGRCKHIKFYKRLIKQLMHEKVRVEKEKGGK